MSLTLEKSDIFLEDFALEALWCVRAAGLDVARRYQEAVDATLQTLCREPGLGRIRHFRNPKLQGLRSLVVHRPFNTLIIFYRVNGNVVQAWRLMHGARDLPRRLVELPGFPPAR